MHVWRPTGWHRRVATLVGTSIVLVALAAGRSAGARPDAPETRTDGPTDGPNPASSASASPLVIRREAFDGSTPIGADPYRKKANLPELVWDPSWRRTGAIDLAVIGVGGATTLASAIISPSSKHHRRGGILFDEQARDVFAIRSVAWRYTARDASDVLLSLSTTYPFFGDSLLLAWWFRGNADVAREMALIDLEALAITGAIQGVANVAASRERPYGRECGSVIPQRTGDCEQTVRYRSFFSGHTSLTFTAAGLICTHHLKLDLTGSSTADAAFCATGFAVAATTGTLRMMANMHYASDVMTGAIVGTAVGLGVPWLHYRPGRSRGVEATSNLEIHLVPTPGGASLTGSF